MKIILYSDEDLKPHIDNDHVNIDRSYIKHMKCHRWIENPQEQNLEEQKINFDDTPKKSKHEMPSFNLFKKERIA